jgi:hypothetical protein
LATDTALAFYEAALGTATALGPAGTPYLGSLFTNIGPAYGELGDLQRPGQL